VIFDTDVLVWYWRGNPRAARLIDSVPAPTLSIVSYMELLRGARNRREVGDIKRFLHSFGFRTLPLSGNIGHRAAVYIEQYGLGVALDVADALIAATAVENNLVLATANRKHFAVVKELALRVFRPS